MPGTLPGSSAVSSGNTTLILNSPHASGNLVVLHPDEVHDGDAGSDAGLGHRELYVDPALIFDAVRQLCGRPHPFASKPDWPRMRLRRHRKRRRNLTDDEFLRFFDGVGQPRGLPRFGHREHL